MRDVWRVLAALLVMVAAQFIIMKLGLWWVKNWSAEPAYLAGLLIGVFSPLIFGTLDLWIRRLKRIRQMKRQELRIVLK